MPCIAQRDRLNAAAGHPDHVPAPLRQPTCRCAAGGAARESLGLRFTEDGRTRTLTLTAADDAQVTAARLARYERGQGRPDAAGDRGHRPAARAAGPPVAAAGRK